MAFELKTILHSKRANLYYLEYCRVLVNGGRVEYLTQENKKQFYWNIPIANTTTILLGTGTSITQAAIRELSKAGIVVGFCGSNGTPLYSATEHELPVVWFLPQNEYRANEYIQAWMRFWFDDTKRLMAAKYLQNLRLDKILHQWTNHKFSKPFFSDAEQLKQIIIKHKQAIEEISNINDLLLLEARFTKILFRLASKTVGYGDFTRLHGVEKSDRANRFLDHGNYLAYGLAATATWVVGLSHAFALMHGKTRRGGLVFDLADLVKDAIVLPQAFSSAMQGDTPQDFRDS